MGGRWLISGKAKTYVCPCKWAMERSLTTQRQGEVVVLGKDEAFGVVVTTGMPSKKEHRPETVDYRHLVF
jgi:hypothetical protein